MFTGSKWHWGALALGVVLAGCLPQPIPECEFCEAYQAEIRGWHQERIQKLKGDCGWLSLAGLFWLKEGENRIGSHPESDIRFPDRAPEHLGTIKLEGTEATLTMAPGVPATFEGKPIAEKTLASDVDKIVVGSFTFLVIERGGKLALRLFDREAETLREFQGIETFPVEVDWRKVGRFEPYDQPKKVMVSTVIQTTEEALVPGEVVFEFRGQEYRLTPMSQSETGELFFVFADQTNGKETYAGGRFLYTLPPADDRVVLDFNRAYNPPCAFTPYSTCPIPRKENRLGFRVEAGEKKPNR